MAVDYNRGAHPGWGSVYPGDPGYDILHAMLFPPWHRRLRWWLADLLRRAAARIEPH